MRICILTFHRAYNCGAMLQSWALQRVLQHMGHIVEFPSCNHVGETARWRYGWVNIRKRGFGFLRAFGGRLLVNLLSIPSEDILIHRYRKFRAMFINERDCMSQELDKHYDAVVVGSDQVWSDVHCQEDAPLFFGTAVPKGLHKVAYAASYGDSPLPAGRLERVVAAAKRFDAVSVRERLAKSQLGPFLQKDIPVVLDPTLLLCPSDYDEVQSLHYPARPYLFMYTLSTDRFMIQTARELAARLKVRCVIAPCNQYGHFNAPRGITYSISPDRLVSYTRHAKYVVAGSFHGTAMGLMFNKPTISLRDHVDNFESRPASLLNSLGCGERLANPKTSIDDMLAMLAEGFSDRVYERLDVLRESSKLWLKEALT